MSIWRIVGRVVLALVIALATVWAGLALWFRLPGSDMVRGAVVAGFVVLALAAMLRRRSLGSFVVAFLGVVIWWQTLTPPETRDYSPEVARQSYGEISGDRLVMHDMRDFTWRSKEDFDANWVSRTYDLAQLETTDVFLSYWGHDYMAHLIVSFGFADGEHLAWSVEVRRQVGGGFSPLADMFKANTLAILAASERDVVGLRTNVRGEDVQLYRLKVRKEAARRILERFVSDASELAEQPKWYHSILTNCTTVVIRIMNEVGAGQAWDWRVMANGYLPEFAYEIGAVNSSVSLEELRELGRVGDRARAHGLGDGFEAAIREGVPLP